MITSMTGFAAGRGAAVGYAWAWDLRSVNGKGLDLRLRVPDWIDGLEAPLRTEMQKAIGRGNVSLTLKVMRDTGAAAADSLAVNRSALTAVLGALSAVEAAARGEGLTLTPTTAAEVLAVRGVWDSAAADEDTTEVKAALLADFPPVLAAFTAMRRVEGEALAGVIAAQIDQIATLTSAAAVEAATRREAQATALREAVAKVLEVADGIDETRIAQELALIAVKTDVQEELDRLAAHVDAARALVAEAGPVGRKLDFLMQEFMREANTLCSKAQAMALTRIGLDLKTVIDQMREQVQNVE